MSLYIQISAGQKYGCYTVLGKADNAGSQEFYNVRCNCGSEFTIGKSRLLTRPEKCRKCAGKEYAAMMAEKRKKYIGQVINGLRVLETAPNAESSGSAAKFLTECVTCGARCLKTLDAIRYKKDTRCKSCPPDYQFDIDGDVAIGKLSNGTKFKIDAEDVDLISRYHWYVNGGGYLFRRDAKSRTPCRMHRLVLGLSQNDGMVVDHLNHDKLDNRKCNLRVGSQADNCLNNIKRCTNTAGHVGVRINGNGDCFTSKIEMDGKEYILLKTYSIEDAAQAYNVAADYLFGVGIGYRNRVLYPSQQFVCSIIEKIKEIQGKDKTDYDRESEPRAPRQGSGSDCRSNR